MNTYLFAWNPKKWHWADLPRAVVEANSNGAYIEPWSTGVNKSVRAGDRAFLMRLGLPPKGIIGSGIVISDPRIEQHWDAAQAAAGNTADYVNIRFEILSDFPLISEQRLRESDLSGQQWFPQGSGILIRPEIAARLETVWSSLTDGQAFEIEERGVSSSHYEGRRYEITISRAERDPAARSECIAHHGTNCAVCSFSFESVYGDIGKDYIHVHHLQPFKHSVGSRQVDPVRDLRPVCPNCHAMIHRRAVPFDIDELRAIVDQTAAAVES